MRHQVATNLGTTEYFKNKPVNQTKMRSIGDCQVSALAIGTYLGDSDETTSHALAARFAALAGGREGAASGFRAVQVALRSRQSRRRILRG